MSKDLVKGALVGAVTASVLVVATAATAGTGVGSVFNLGRTNSVNARSVLTGSNSRPELVVTNTGAGAALRLNASTGKPPLVVSNKVRVPNLNASYVGGKSASALVTKCQPGSVAAVAVFYAPQIPNDPTYVTPTRYGGEGGFSCAGGMPQITKEGTGFFRMQMTSALPSTLDYVLFVNPDARGGTPLYADGNSEFAGPAWDIHVFDKNGAPADPYYLDVQLLAD